MGCITPTGNIRIGVDVGGTNTDAVALDLSAQHTETRGVIAHFKTPTTPDVTSGIETAVGTVIKAAGVSLDSIACVTIGTTHFINAVVEQDARRLRKVGVLRLSKSFLRQIPPFSEFPTGLARLIKSYVGYVDGGLHIDGAEEAPIVEEQVVQECAEIRKHGVSALVVAGIFSPIDEEYQQEKRVRDIVLREIAGIDVVCSHEVSNIGFLERENAAILNASILKYGRRTVRGFREAMSRLNLKCGLYITQNDGTLIDAASAARMPIRTFSSGATNSMRGAAYLAGKSLDGTSAIVVDIGGTTSDAGVLLQSGFPRQASAFVTVSGVKVNYKTVTITEIDSLPVSYVANKLRTVVKAVGELDIARQPTPLGEKDDLGEEEEIEKSKDYGEKFWEETPVDPFTYRPDIKLREGYTLKIVDASVLPDDACVYWGGHMGSPAVSVERLNATETVEAFRALMEYLKHDSFDAVIGLEIGGANGLEPLLVGSSKYFNRPTIDADFMGRAYPTYWQTTIAVHEPGSLVPCAIDSGDGKTIIMTRASTDEIVDRALRASCAEMGSRVGKAGAPTTASTVRRTAVINTYSLAWRIGRCIARSEASNTLSKVCESIVQEVGGEATARILFRGKIVAVERRLFKGHSYGEITIASMPADEEDEGAKDAMPASAAGGTLKIPFKNENLYAEHTSDSGERRMVCTVPDLIAVLDTGAGRALGVPEFRYGLRVTVLGITASPQWTSTETGLKIGGPKAFGYDLEYKPLGVYVEPKSVIAEYTARQ
ncbi:putative hydantoinase [Diplodia seriata]|uniref:Putative hydantoinase n=1 Tax=Diplodia seriata TaxID=420778 RepID=A0A0G2EGA3_9PEZI|nr:putative hydantoinase [Diplodia seriata]